MFKKIVKFILLLNIFNKKNRYILCKLLKHKYIKIKTKIYN